MLSIKKVSVVPLENYGTIVDSFNTQDDHQTNAPSLNAVENYAVAKENFTTVTGSVTRTAGDEEVTAYVNLPTGYTIDNTRVITYSYQVGTVSNNRNYSASMSVGVSHSILQGDLLNIRITGNVLEVDVEYVYEVILMKVS